MAKSCSSCRPEGLPRADVCTQQAPIHSTPLYCWSTHKAPLTSSLQLPFATEQEINWNKASALTPGLPRQCHLNTAASPTRCKHCSTLPGSWFIACCSMPAPPPLSAQPPRTVCVWLSIAQRATLIPQALIQSCNPFLEWRMWCTHPGCARAACLITFWGFTCSGQQPRGGELMNNQTPKAALSLPLAMRTRCTFFESLLHLAHRYDQTLARVWSFIWLKWNQIAGGISRNKMDECSWQSPQKKASNSLSKECKILGSFK